MKVKICILIAIVLIFTFSGCNSYGTLRFDFTKNDFVILEEADSHGGFHGDGSYYLILDCSDNQEKAKEIVADWSELPLSENLNIMMYGGEGRSYNLAEDAHWPVFENGVYKFVDRHSESTNESDDSDLFNRASFNFSVAVYDTDSDMLYYFEFDT